MNFKTLCTFEFSTNAKSRQTWKFLLSNQIFFLLLYFTSFAWNISLANIFHGSVSHVLLIYQNSLLFSLDCARNKIPSFILQGRNFYSTMIKIVAWGNGCKARKNTIWILYNSFFQHVTYLYKNWLPVRMWYLLFIRIKFLAIQ